MNPASSDRSRAFRVATFDQLERVPLDEGQWRPVRRSLEITGFAVNAYTAGAGERVIEEHDELAPVAVATRSSTWSSPERRASPSTASRSKPRSGR